MQTKHLHGLLRVLLPVLFVGCGEMSRPSENLYLTEKKEIKIDIQEGQRPFLVWGSNSARFLPNRNGRWDTLWVENPSGHPAKLTTAYANAAEIISGGQPFRSLTTLSVFDSATGLTRRWLPLPGGKGFAYYIEGESSRQLSSTFSIVSELAFHHRGDIFSWSDSAQAYAVWGGFDEASLAAASKLKSVWKESEKNRQFLFATADNEDAAISVIKRYQNESRERLENALYDFFTEHSEFYLATQDDRTNQAVALLLSALSGNPPNLNVNSRSGIETLSHLAVAQFLANRTVTPIVFLDSLTRKDMVRWGAAAIRAALKYGMIPDKDREQLELAVLSELTVLDEDYRFNFEVTADPEISDSLNRLAMAHARLADVMSLGEQISHSRGQTNAASIYRTKALRGGRMTKQYIQEAWRSYERAQIAAEETGRELRDITDTTVVEEQPQKEPLIGSTPDTMLYLSMGAKTNFSWIANDPQDYVAQPLDLFTWQRWVAYRFEKEIKLNSTVDYDSLLKMLLNGPVPGSLVDTVSFSYNHPALATAAALQNLSEIYLGVNPEWFRGNVKIVPRPPANWGRTSARVPLGAGFLILEYDFLHDRATVAIDHIEKELDFIFYFPLPASESSAGAQFKLAPDRPKVELTLKRESGNRTRVNIEDIK